ncbi:MAG: hypothetical protein U0935_16580 [Pirellulales bacterium]
MTARYPLRILSIALLALVLAGCDGGSPTSVPAKPDPRPTSGPVERSGTTQEAPVPDASKKKDDSVSPSAAKPD